MTDYTILPDGLPVPEDDGAADHLPGTPLPPLALADALRLPTFAAPGHDRLYSRLTLVVRDGAIEHVFYPVFPPNTHAQQVLDWLAHHPAPESAQEQ